MNNSEAIKLFSSRDSSFELVDKRGQFSKTFNTNNNSEKLVISHNPIHFLNSSTNQYEDISLNSESKEKELVFNGNGFKTSFNKDSSSRGVFSISKDNYSLSLDIQNDTKGDTLSKVVDNSKLVINKSDNVQYIYEVLNDRVKEKIVISAYQDSYDFAFNLNLDNLIIDLKDDGSINLIDPSTKEIKFYIPKPFMVDSLGNISNDVNFLIDKTERGISIQLIVDEEWINKSSFPITIDPEIVEFTNPSYTIKSYRKVTSYNSGGPIINWVESSYYGNSIDSNWRFEFIINLNSLGVPLNKMISISFTFEFASNGYVIFDNIVKSFSSNSPVSFDITNKISSGQTSFLLEVPSGYTISLGVAPLYSPINSVTIEYIANEQVNEKEEFPLINNISSLINPVSGEPIVTIKELTTIKENGLSIPLSLVYKRHNDDYHLGYDFLTNLNQRIYKSGDNYFYLNELGIIERIDEHFYYIDDTGRVAVDKYDVTLSNNQTLITTVDGGVNKVYREQLTKSGLSFYSRIEDVDGVQYLEQRLDEERELEEYINNCVISFKSLRLFHKEEREEVDFSLSFSDDYDNFNEFLDNVNEHVIVINQSMLIEYLSLEDEMNQNLIIDSSIAQLPQIKAAYLEYLVKRKELNELKRLIPTWVLVKNNIKYGFNRFGDLCAVFNDYDYLSINRDYIDTENGLELAITSITSDKSAISFEYDYFSKLSLINNNGQLVKFSYSNNELIKVNYPNNHFLRFTYDDDLLRSVYDSNQLCLYFTHDVLNKLNDIKIYNLFSQIDSSSTASLTETSNLSSLSPALFSQIHMDYFSHQTDITVNEDSYTYYYDDNAHIYEVISKNNNEYTSIKLSYYVEGSFTLNIYPMKASDRLDSGTSIDNEVSTKLSSFNISLPNINSQTSGVYPNYGESEYELYELDEFNRVKSKRTNWIKTGSNEYQKTIVNYIYDAYDHHYPCIKQISARFLAPNTLLYQEVEEYEYNKLNQLIKKKNYVIGEELISGVNIEEYEYDDRGNLTISRRYNTLSSSEKFYSEKTYLPNDLVDKSIDEINDNETVYKYDSMNRLVEEISSGQRIGYGYDDNDYLNSINNSNDIGEGNIVNRIYKFGYLVNLNDKNNTINYSYDKKGRITSITYNNVTSSFSYSGSLFDSSSVITTGANTKCNQTFSDVKADKVVINEYTEQKEHYYDKKGREVLIKAGNTIYYLGEYSNDLLTKQYFKENSNDYLVIFAYDGLNRISNTGVIKNSNLIQSESYEYNNLNKLSSKTMNLPSLNFKYAYSYSSDSSHVINNISLYKGSSTSPSFSLSPYIDKYNRYIGRDISSGSSNLIQKERISYKQIGDHASILPVSVYYSSYSSGVITNLTNLKYKYDKKGNIREIIENDTLINRYHYDYLNRLIREDNRKLNKTYLFSYDNNGNILTKRETNFTLIKSEELSSFNNETSYRYNGDLLIGVSNSNISYDSFLRPSSYKGNNLSWSGKRLTQYGNTTFTYDGLGRRVSKNTYSYSYDSSDNLVLISNSGTPLMYFLYDNKGVTGFIYNNEEYLYRKNIFGDVTHIFKVNNNQIVATYIYDAWGNHIILDSSNNDVTNSSSHIGYINPFRYRSYFYDNETGLYYLKSRYYDSSTGRFIILDNLSFLNPDRPSGLNLYIYCYNNPLMYVDEDGEDAFLVLLIVGGLIAGAGIGLAVSGSILKNNTMTTIGVVLFSIGEIVLGVMCLSVGIIDKGFGLIGTGFGSLIAGTISHSNGGNFFSSWFASQIAGLSATFIPKIGVAIGLAAGSIVEDLMDNKQINISKVATSLLIGSALSCFGLIVLPEIKTLYDSLSKTILHGLLSFMESFTNIINSLIDLLRGKKQNA